MEKVRANFAEADRQFNQFATTFMTTFAEACKPVVEVNSHER